MKRRAFLKMAGAASLAPMVTPSLAAAENPAYRDYYELRQYHFEKEDQKKAFDGFMREAAIPAFNRLGIEPVGVFFPDTGFSPAYVLLRHKTMDSIATLTQRLAGDEAYIRQGSRFLDAPAGNAAFKRMESSCLLAFKGMPQLEIPVKSAGRVFQLRTYESPSVKTGQKKIEMFNDAGEIKIFREVGLNPVFFGETLAGSKMPNLTYMLAFKSMEEQKASWQRFGQHPLWKQLRAMPEYADKAILCGITNLSLVAAEYSQI